ncbi:MAG: MBL fold metallo-hydrolase [Acidimicrobiia bacterium]|nr:MBL fold metallo-hydrolase [Acidimicrobiia bacterium]
MIFEQYYLDCLSHASYLVGDETTGRAVVVDPRRDVQQYLDDATAHGLEVCLVIETHFHADFLSGHLELMRATGAEIGYGAAAADVEFEIRRLHDGESIDLGDVRLEILATPGHTPESICVVVYEHAGDATPFGILTGDTLFIGDVGRPDLLASVGHTAEDLAGALYDSLRDKILALAPETRVFPAHGAGSACGRSLSTATESTLAEELRTNYALAPMTKHDFVDLVTEGQPAAPPYFLYDAMRNRQARPVLDETEVPRPLPLDEVRRLQEDGAVVLDCREPADFGAAHLAGAVNVGLSGRYAEYTGDVVDPATPIVLVTPAGMEAEARVRLGRIGYDNVLGYLADPEEAFRENEALVRPTSRLTANALRARMGAVSALQLVDVRQPAEVEAGGIPGAVNIPLPHLASRLGELDPDLPTVVYCAGGYRSSIGTSRLEAAGFADVSNLVGGYAAWEAGETVPATST